LGCTRSVTYCSPKPQNPYLLWSILNNIKLQKSK